MKVLIWFLWLMVFAIIQGLVNLGFFPTVLLLWLFSYLASACCRDWEKQKILKDAEKAALTPFEYLKDKFPNDILAECEKRRGNKAELEKYLEEQRKDLNIKKVYQEFLLEEFLQASKEEVPTVFAPSPVGDIKQGKASNSSGGRKIVARKASPAKGIKSNITQDRPVFCRKCGTRLLEGSDFCHKCGAEVIKG